MKYKKAIYKARNFMRTIYFYTYDIDTWLKCKDNICLEYEYIVNRKTHKRSYKKRDFNRLFGKGQNK